MGRFSNGNARLILVKRGALFDSYRAILAFLDAKQVRVSRFLAVVAGDFRLLNGYILRLECCNEDKHELDDGTVWVALLYAGECPGRLGRMRGRRGRPATLTQTLARTGPAQQLISTCRNHVLFKLTFKLFTLST